MHDLHWPNTNPFIRNMLNNAGIKLFSIFQDSIKSLNRTKVFNPGEELASVENY
jgi:hypothetical protein